MITKMTAVLLQKKTARVYGPNWHLKHGREKQLERFLIRNAHARFVGLRQKTLSEV